MIVSPSSAQFVVVAVLASVSGLNDVDAVVFAFKKSGVCPESSIVPAPIVKYPEEASGPSTGWPSWF